MPEATPSVLHGRRPWLRRAFHETQTVLDLSQPQLELLDLVASDEPELGEDALQAVAGTLGQPRRVTPPANDSLLDQLAGLIAPQSPTLGELTRELVDALGSQRDSAYRGQAEPLGEVSR